MAPNGLGRLRANHTQLHPAHRFAQSSDHALREAEQIRGGRIAPFWSTDFRAHSTDGMGDDWPITYEELAPTTRQSRILHRRLRLRRKHHQLSRRRFSSSSQAAMQRNPDQKSLRQTEHHLHSFAPCHPYQAIERSRSLSLLRTVRSRLQKRFELQLQRVMDSLHSAATGRLTMIANAICENCDRF